MQRSPVREVAAGDSTPARAQDPRAFCDGDAHGEVDLGLQRGKPLSLDEQEYLGLTRKWLGMSFDDTAKGDEAEAMF